MARPKSVGDEEVLRAAARVIGRSGPVDFTIRQVADEAGLSAAAVMQRFGTKRRLLLALAERAGAAMAAAFDEAARAHASRRAAVVEALVANAADLGPPREMANHVAFLAMDLQDPELHARTLAHFDAMRRRVRALLEEAAAAGEIPPGSDLDALARMAEVAYHGALVSWAIRRQGSVADAIRFAVGRALGPPPG